MLFMYFCHSNVVKFIKNLVFLGIMDASEKKSEQLIKEKIKEQLDELINRMVDELGYQIYPQVELTQLIQDEKYKQGAQSGNIRMLYKNSEDTTLSSALNITQLDDRVFVYYALCDRLTNEIIIAEAKKIDEVDDLSRLVHAHFEYYLTKGCTNNKNVLALRSKYKI